MINNLKTESCLMHDTSSARYAVDRHPTADARRICRVPDKTHNEKHIRASRYSAENNRRKTRSKSGRGRPMRTWVDDLERLDWLETIRPDTKSSRKEILTWDICNPQQWMQQLINYPLQMILQNCQHIVLTNHGRRVVANTLIAMVMVVLTTTTSTTIFIWMVIDKNILIVRLRMSCLLASACYP